jgi:hypothetical protein
VKIKESNMSLSQRVLGAVDLAIEFATLGEYGLEHIEPTPTTCGRQRTSRRLPTTRSRRSCDTPRFSTACLAEAHTARR